MASAASRVRLAPRDTSIRPHPPTLRVGPSLSRPSAGEGTCSELALVDLDQLAQQLQRLLARTLERVAADLVKSLDN